SSSHVSCWPLTSRVHFLLPLRAPSPSTLFPSTTLFRSGIAPSWTWYHTDRRPSGTDSTVVVVIVGPVVMSFRSPRSSARVRKSPDRKSTRLNSSHVSIAYAVFCLKKKNQTNRAYSGLNS